jgi:putative phosphoesterase
MESSQAQPPAGRPHDPEAVRVAILSDTHGEVDPRVLEVVTGCDLAVHGGDIGGGGVLDSIARHLRSGADGLHVVRGNNDIPGKWAGPHRDLLPRLPEHIEIGLPGGRLVVIHGHQTAARDRHERLRRRFPDARAIVYGHSHRLVLDQLAEPWVVNPGAAGRSRTFGGPSCLVLTAEGLGWRLESHRFPLARGLSSNPETTIHPTEY